MLKLWGRLNSLNVQKVVLALEESGTPYERIDAGLQFGHNKTPEYLAKNPMGLVPLLEDDGFVLWESNAIARYICAKYAPAKLYYEDLQARADAERWMDWQGGALNGALVPAFYNLIRVAPEKRDMVAVEASLQKTTELVAIFDAHMKGRDFVSGNQFGFGDMGMAPIIHRWLNMPCEIAPVPHAKAWYQRMMQRAACQKVLTLPLT
jgi:glutathione S-transferase